MTFAVVRHITNGDAVTDTMIVGLFATRLEADRAARIFRDAHPISIGGDAVFVVKEYTTPTHRSVTINKSA
jgi:hypothetical protein